MRKHLPSAISSAAIRYVLVCGSQAAMFAFAGATAFLLRFDFSIPSNYLRDFVWAVPIWVIVKTLTFQLAKLNRRGWRYVSFVDLYRLVVANSIASIISCGTILLLLPRGFPRSLYALDFTLCVLGTTGLRASIRMIAELTRTPRAAGEKRALIYGAGDAGITLLREIRNNSRLSYHVVGFIDDCAGKQNLRLGEVSVIGQGDQVAKLVTELAVDIILIAIPSATGAEMNRILELCRAADAPCKTVPGLAEVIEGRALAGQIRDVAVEDLLGRTQIHLEEEQIRRALEGCVVLVTGAAGSIGSELCRQIARFQPTCIVGFDIAESPLFEIDREMRRQFPSVPFHPEIGNIQNRARLSELFNRYRPSTVYHAAAFKHVPLMESHVFEAVENNVFGTRNVAVSAAEHGVADFVLISSDKAVRPGNIMGATKRIAELVLTSLQNGHTKYVAVRFGNVLGSSGSVIPIFKQQIAAGGPVTVTHPEMRRFFMTVPEACQLVLQAATIGRDSQICVLDMGEPVKILDLARNLITFSGLRPDEDIQIQFTGIRPGEKLYEELGTVLENTVPTSHEKIRIFASGTMQCSAAEEWLESLRAICERRDLGQLISSIRTVVPDYTPSADLLKQLIAKPEQAGNSFAVDLRASLADRFIAAD
jgi:FlaA1/EpsC-like NDP-sugar epimerase